MQDFNCIFLKDLKFRFAQVYLNQCFLGSRFSILSKAFLALKIALKNANLLFQGERGRRGDEEFSLLLELYSDDSEFKVCPSATGLSSGELELANIANILFLINKTNVFL
ncbi:hypothetical protein H1P_810027 [Hyella patelloides LEGE 07179]|uniref:Uncharacterized protein n=1 Tax=Hyella patelloides LEGE 07179 TaxID=945734 RepID=A0A563W4G8_9CYAN|nr:hypothetical protein H1P_810027 [Hyella patelloides LEGE 07179]